VKDVPDLLGIPCEFRVKKLQSEERGMKNTHSPVLLPIAASYRL